MLVCGGGANIIQERYPEINVHCTVQSHGVQIFSFPTQPSSTYTPTQPSSTYTPTKPSSTYTPPQPPSMYTPTYPSSTYTPPQP